MQNVLFLTTWDIKLVWTNPHFKYIKMLDKIYKNLISQSKSKERKKERETTDVKEKSEFKIRAAHSSYPAVT